MHLHCTCTRTCFRLCRCIGTRLLGSCLRRSPALSRNINGFREFVVNSMVAVCVTLQDEKLSKNLLSRMLVCISCASANAMHLLYICRNRALGPVIVRHQQKVRTVLLKA